MPGPVFDNIFAPEALAGSSQQHTGLYPDWFYLLALNFKNGHLSQH